MPRRYEFLSDEDLETFLTHGYVLVKNAFTRAQGEEWAAQTFTRLGYDPNDTATWEKSRIHMPSHRWVEVKEFAPRAYGAICELCGGEERIKTPAIWGDGFIVNLGSSEDPEVWQPPSPTAPGWHKDGDFFRHFLDSPEQGLLTIVLWSDVLPRGGSTYVSTDSVPVVARFLAEHPEGVHPGEFSQHNLIGQCHEFIEATGEIGDVYLLHPYILHASSKNALRLPRSITNPAVHLREPMNFNRPDGDYSPVEQAILRGLGADHLDFTPTAAREQIVPERVRMQQKMKEEEQARLAALAG